KRRDPIAHPKLVDQRCVLSGEAVAFSACCGDEEQEPNDGGQHTAQRARQQHPVLSLATTGHDSRPLERSPDRHETVTGWSVDETSCPEVRTGATTQGQERGGGGGGGGGRDAPDEGSVGDGHGGAGDA